MPRECPEINDEIEEGVINLDSTDNVVVLVDDDAAMHGLIKRTIAKLNLTLIGATNGEKGMDLIREIKPKLILLDVLMPGRDGWSILKECKLDDELKDIPVIMISQLDKANFAASLGANEYMTKPIDRELFVTGFEIENMIETIKDVSAPLALKNNNEFQINIDDSVGSMSQDETKLRQCLTNFLSNAFKFTKDGTVTLDIDVEIKEKTEFISFSVTDTGAGMSAEGVAKVFEEYTQAERSTSANYGGTGLGLPISKRFAEMMGGDVSVSSEELSLIHI